MLQSKKSAVRVLQFVGWGMLHGGIETWLMHVLRNIDRERFRIDFVVEAEGNYDDEVRALGSKIIFTPHHRRPLAFKRNFEWIMRNHGPYDVVHSHYYFYSGYILQLARQSGVRIRVVHSHNDFTKYSSEQGIFWQGYYNLMRRWISWYSTNGLAVSREAAAAMFGPNWEADPRWQVFYCGIDLNPFRIPYDPVAVRTELGIPADTFVVGHVGRFFDQKNHTFLVDIAAELIKREPKARFLLIGDGPLRPGIEQRVIQAGIADKCIFAGRRNDVARLMLGAMDAFVLPSLFEGLPLVGMEVQAAGLPFVMSDTITEEVDIVKPLIQRLPLSRAASVWAETILATRRNIIPSITQREAMIAVERSKFSIGSSVRELEKIYVR